MQAYNFIARLPILSSYTCSFVQWVTGIFSCQLPHHLFQDSYTLFEPTVDLCHQGMEIRGLINKTSNEKVIKEFSFNKIPLPLESLKECMQSRSACARRQTAWHSSLENVKQSFLFIVKSLSLLHIDRLPAAPCRGTTDAQMQWMKSTIIYLFFRQPVEFYT